MLTKGLDNIQGTSGDDTIIGSIDNNGTPNVEMNTVSALDIIDGGKGIDTLKIAVMGGATVTLPNMSNVEIVQIESAVGATVDTSKVAGVTNLNVLKAAGAVAATAAATTDIAVTVKEDGASSTLAHAIKGGKDVTVTATDMGTASGTNADTIAVGGAGTAAAAGNVVVNMTGTAYTAATAASTLSAVTVTGGKSISVTQKATSDASAAATDASNVLITQGAVTITGNDMTETVTVKQDAAVAAKNAAVAVAAKAATQEITFTAAKNGDKVTLTFDTNKTLTLTAKADMTAAEVASAFANLGTDAYQGSLKASTGIYTNGTAAGLANGWTSGAVQTVDATKAKVVFSTMTSLPNGPTAITAASTGSSANIAAPVASVTAGTAEVKAETGVMGVAAGAVTIDDSATHTIKTITVDSYGAGSKIGNTTSTDKLETLNLSNVPKAATAVDMVVAKSAATLALNVEKMGGGTLATVPTLTFTTAPTTLNVKSTGDNNINLTADATETLNVSGTGLLDVSAKDLAALTSVKVTESAGLKLHTGVADTVTSVDTTGTTGAVTVSIQGDKATYAGGAGVDNVTITNPGTAISKAIDLGAGDDRLDLSGATPLVPTVTLKGGAGDDTIVLKSADAASLTSTDSFSKKIDSFEKLEVAQAVAEDRHTISLANLNDIKYVISKGQLNAGDVYEQQTVKILQTLSLGMSVTVNGVTVKNTSALSPVNANDVAIALSGGTPSVVGLTVSGTASSDWKPTKLINCTDDTVTYTATSYGDKLKMTESFPNVAVVDAVTVTATVNGGSVAETNTIPLLGLSAGQSYTILGVKVTAVNNMTADQVIDAFVNAMPASFGTTATASTNAQLYVTSGTYTNTNDSKNWSTSTLPTWTKDTSNGVVLKVVNGDTTTDVSNTIVVTSSPAITVTPSDINEVSGKKGSFATTQTFTKVLDDATVEMTAAGNFTEFQMKNTDGAADKFNIITKAANGADLGTVKVAGVEKIAIKVVDTDNSSPTAVSTNTLALDANKADAITLTGDGNLTLSLQNNSALKLIDAQAMTGALSLSTLAAHQDLVVKGGSANDTLTAVGKNIILEGGAGNDTLRVGASTAAVLKGGAGVDKFDVSTFVGTKGGAVTIADLEKGETIKFAANAAADFISGKATLIGASNFTEYVAEAAKTASADKTKAFGIAWFQYTDAIDGANTYIVQNKGADNTFDDGTDIIVKLAGQIDLSASSFNADNQGTLMYL